MCIRKKRTVCISNNEIYRNDRKDTVAEIDIGKRQSKNSAGSVDIGKKSTEGSASNTKDHRQQDKKPDSANDLNHVGPHNNDSHGQMTVSRLQQIKAMKVDNDEALDSLMEEMTDVNLVGISSKPLPGDGGTVMVGEHFTEPVVQKSVPNDHEISQSGPGKKN